MKRDLANVSVLVRDYDEAIAFYTEKLGFQLLEDTDLGNGKRWVLVTPGGEGSSLLLAKANGPEQSKRVGDQTGGRVFLFLHTDDFSRDYQSMRSKGVVFLEEPREEIYAKVVIFEDLYGNKWDLLQLKPTMNE